MTEEVAITPLSELLSNEPVTTTPEPEPEALNGPTRDENGRFASKTGVEPDEPQGEVDAVPPTDKLPQEDYKAIREEREKRQNLERELEALRNQIQQLQQPQQPPAPPPSVWDDEQAYGGHIVTTAVQQATFNAKLDMSEMMARQANPDFEEMKARFLQMADQNPSLGQQALADPHPWNKAYQIASNAAKMEALGAVDVNDMREKLKAELLAEMQQGSSPVAPQSLPPSLSGERSVASRSGPAWAGPTPLAEILGRR
jgi:hypothetical protein